MLKKKIKEIVIGSNNEGKIKEIRDLLPKYYKITSPKDYGLKSPKENGNTFLKKWNVSLYTKASTKDQHSATFLN